MESVAGTVQRDCNYAPRGPSWLPRPFSLHNCAAVRGGVLAEHHSFQTHYRSCPQHQQVACPQDLQAARGLKAGELRVSWQRVANLQDSPALLGEPAVTVIVDGGGTAVVGTAPAIATSVLFDTTPRGRDLAIAVALTRQGHVISEVCRIHIRSTQTRTGDRTPYQTSSLSAPPPVPTTAPIPPTTDPPPTTTPLSPVTGLMAAPASHNSMTLSWNAPSSTANLANFQLQRCDSADCTGGTDIATPSATDRTYTVTTGLDRNTLYHFQIRAVAKMDSGYEDSDWSTASGTTAKQPLPVVAGLTAAAGNPAYNSMALTWTAPASTDGRAEFGLEWCSASGCGPGTSEGTDTAPAAETTSTVTGLTRDREYHFQIRAVATQNSGYANSEWSATVLHRTEKQPLPALTGVRAGASSSAGVAVIAWDPVTAWDSLTREALANFGIAVCTGLSSTTCPSTTTGTAIAAESSWNHAACGAGITCYLRVRAQATSTSGYAHGPWSDVIEATGAGN